MTHTPGPWDYRPMEFDDWGWVRARNGGEIVARAGGFASQEEQARHRAVGTDPYEANARLIAAAPDLLAVAKLLIGYCSNRAGMLNPYEDWIQCFIEDGSTITEVVEKAQAAIDKSESGVA